MVVGFLGYLTGYVRENDLDAAWDAQLVHRTHNSVRSVRPGSDFGAENECEVGLVRMSANPRYRLVPAVTYGQPVKPHNGHERP